MLYIDYVTKELIADIAQLVKLFSEYEYLTWIFMCSFWILWMFLKYMLLTLPIRLVFTNLIQNTYNKVVHTISK